MEKRPKLKEMAPKDRPGYIWEYYRWPIILILFAAISSFSLIKTLLTNRDPEFSVIMINNVSNETTPLDEFLKGQGITYWKGMTGIAGGIYYNEDGTSSNAYNTDMALLAYISAGQYDMFFGTGKKFENLADLGSFMDLRDYLPADTLSKVPEDHIIYSHPENIAAQTGEGAAAESYPCAIIFDNAKLLYEYYPDTSVYVGSVHRAPHEALIKALMENMISDCFE